MNDKQKIVLIYVSAAVISILIIYTTWMIRGRQHAKQVEQIDKPYYEQQAEFEPLLTLEKDIVLQRQDGKEVKISDLKGKVWAFAQFYASCPMCAKRNSQGLKSLYEKFKDNPDFVLVCITVNPEHDGVEQMKSYAEGLDASASNWWFLTGDSKELKDYMINEMKYQKIVKRDDPEEAARLGEYEHDMSIAVYDRNLSMIDRHDLFNARQKGEAFFKG
ncbi:MAG: SCO family protein, partial [Verrucomicrobiae bacterium]|nr:SCO family protein [Verrucomicrobiae bacterium]NNJ86255.1 redoxin family protein [Akkermansiaceae bacterium]